MNRRFIRATMHPYWNLNVENRWLGFTSFYAATSSTTALPYPLRLGGLLSIAVIRFDNEIQGNLFSGHVLPSRVGLHSTDMLSLVLTTRLYFNPLTLKKRWLTTLTEATHPLNANSNSYLPSTAPLNAFVCPSSRVSTSRRSGTSRWEGRARKILGSRTLRWF